MSDEFSQIENTDFILKGECKCGEEKLKNYISYVIKLAIPVTLPFYHSQIHSQSFF